MTYAILTSDAEDAAAGAVHRLTSTKPNNRMRDSRIIGALFLAGFVAYGTGFGLVTSVIGAPDFLSNFAVNRNTLVLGALLMLLTIVTDVWRAVVFFPILGERGRSTALTYLAAQIVSVSMFFIGALSLLLIIPLGQHAGGMDTGWATALGSLLVQSNENAYSFAQMSLVFGSLSLWVFGLRVGSSPGLSPAMRSSVTSSIWGVPSLSSSTSRSATYC